MKICTIIGARPQFIKAATITRAIAKHNALPSNTGHRTLNEIIVHTGQHYDDEMSAIFFRELEIPAPKYNLNIGSGSHGLQTGQMLTAIEKVLLKEKPDWVLIYGDTNSTLAGALAAAKLHIRIAHVEAGLRSFNRLMPEEINRVVADQLSHLLFCPSQTAVNNLAAEGIPSPLKPNASHFTPHVVITGDVMADSLKFAAAKTTHSSLLAKLNLEPQKYLLATVHRAENTDNPDRLTNIMNALSELAESEDVVLPLHPRTRKMLGKSFPIINTSSTINLEHRNLNISKKCHCEEQLVRRGNHNVERRTLNLEHGLLQIIDPVGYFDMIALEKSAHMILTDSGGMQKEAYWLKVPCITLRDETEWIETVEKGWNILTVADHDRIIEAARALKTPSDHPPLYGDGQAAAHCLKALLEYNL